MKLWTGLARIRAPVFETPGGKPKVQRDVIMR